MKSIPTPDSIRAEHAEVTEAGVIQLANFLQVWMANEHNGKDFVSLAKDKEIGEPSDRARVILGSALDWFAYGN